MTAFLSPVFGAGAQLFNNSGSVLAGGRIYTYVAGSSVAAATFTTPVASVANANPIILDSAGRPPQEVWLLSGSTYRFVITDSVGTPVAYSYDNISGVNDFVVLTASEWILGGAPTYVSATQFTLSGDQTAIYLSGRRTKCTVTAGSAFSTVASSSASLGVTTVTLTNDSTPLDNGLTEVYYGLIGPTPNSLPTSSITAASIQVQAATAFTTAGTAGAYTLTPTPAIASLQINQRFNVKFHIDNTAAPTISINGTTAINLVKMNADGTLSNLAAADLPVNWRSDVAVVSLTQALVFDIPSTAVGFITASSTTTLTNKTVNLTNNTLSGTVAQFNTALSDGNFATIGGTETLTGKTLTAPVISSIVNTGTLTLPTATDTLVGRTTTDTMTNKTLTTVSLRETKVVVAAANLDLATANCFTKTITAITTFTVSNVPTTGNVGSLILDLTNGGAFAVTWWSGVKWAGGTAPTLTTSGRDVLGFFTHDGGTTWNGVVLGLAMA
jgi:hypothetical protein